MVVINNWATEEWGNATRRALLGIGCLAVVCYDGIWLAFRPPIQLLLPPDATEVHVVDDGWAEWTLTYRAPGPAYAWYVTVARQLEANGWMQSGEQYTGGPLFPVTYTRITSFRFVALWERVELDGDLHGAQIRMRRWVVLLPLSLYQRWQAISYSMDEWPVRGALEEVHHHATHRTPANL